MSELRCRRFSLGLVSAVIAMTAWTSGSALATDIIILREVPPHNAIEAPVGGKTVSVQVEQGEMIQSLLSGPQLSDDEVGSVLASPPGGALRGGLPASDAVNTLDGSQGDALSNVPNNGMGSFSSLNGIGGQISGQVNSAVQTGLQGLSSSLGAAGGGQ